MHYNFKELGQEFEQTPGDGKGQEPLVSCSPRGRKESNVAQWLNSIQEAT